MYPLDIIKSTHITLTENLILLLFFLSLIFILNIGVFSLPGGRAPGIMLMVRRFIFPALFLIFIRRVLLFIAWLVSESALSKNLTDVSTRWRSPSLNQHHLERENTPDLFYLFTFMLGIWRRFSASVNF